MKIIDALQEMVAKHETDDALILSIVLKVNAFLPDDKFPTDTLPTPEQILLKLSELPDSLRLIIGSIPLTLPPVTEIITPGTRFTIEDLPGKAIMAVIAVMMVIVSLVSADAFLSSEVLSALVEWLDALLEFVKGQQ